MEEFHRIRRLPPYVFEQVNRVKAHARNAGADIVDLGMGNPDLPAPAHVLEKLKETLGRPRTDRYSSSRGIPGLRRAQAKTRENIAPVELKRGRFKVHPLYDWTDRDVGRYLKENALPYHPLWDKGYLSIGDWHTTRSMSEVDSVEELRFFGLKRECGLHE